MNCETLFDEEEPDIVPYESKNAVVAKTTKGSYKSKATKKPLIIRIGRNKRASSVTYPCC